MLYVGHVAGLVLACCGCGMTLRIAETTKWHSSEAPKQAPK